MPLFRDKFEVPDRLLKELRSRFSEEINSSPEAAAKYHPDDIERVKKNDWFIARYLLHQDLNIDNGFKMLKESLQFRNDMEINTLKRENLPDAYFDARTLQIYNHDKLNHPVLVVRCKAHKKSSEETRLHQQYMLWWVEKAVRMNDWGGLAVLFDCSGASYKNLDLDMVRFILNIFKHHYAWSMYNFMIYNMPWYLSALWKLFKQLIPEKHLNRVVFLDQNSILEHIDIDKLPICMGGTCTDQYESKNVKESSKGWF